MRGCDGCRVVPTPFPTITFSAADRELLLGPSPSMDVILRASQIAKHEPEVRALMEAGPPHGVVWSPRLRVWVGIDLYGGRKRGFRFGATADDLKWTPAFRPEMYETRWLEKQPGWSGGTATE